MSRHRARERALQTLFQLDINDLEQEQAVEYTQNVLADAVGEQSINMAYFRRLVSGVLDHKTYIDSILDRYSQEWEVTRMPGVDRSILRIAVYELLFEEDLPPAVAIDEAVSLSKVYGTENSSKFVNGVLSALLEELPQLRARCQETP
ncbi:transcription antitermination factor NusB [Sulfoacidibacillus thermotolerans]|uniref:Transcription antitermination protein NusB n=1 Tax=Sulfoacidibacillus thermotolerans TaxID=1765684 RepID=A0A2U3DC08_SULT2|nr:transcription antitermination factor NusB [Sulfoacidibacillus thermotolerans]PWI58785.1 transcription antitermination factor NusB [Sulfoacidibacillus thermotolerans]